MKNRVVYSLLSCATVGVPMCLVQWMLSGSLAVGVMTGLIIGALFTAFMMIFRRLTQQGARMLHEVGGWADEEKVLKSGPANLIRSNEGIGGTLYLTDRRIRFRAHRFNVDVGDYSFSLASVQSAAPSRIWGIYPTGLLVRLSDGRQMKFVVYDRADWAAAIQQQAGLWTVS